MPQEINPTAVPTPTIEDLVDLEQQQPLKPYHEYSELDEEECRAIENQAREEISRFEYQARLQARVHFPLEPLPRAKSNIRSVKRSRFVQKELERVLNSKILEKVKRNRELDQLIEFEKERLEMMKEKLEQFHKSPDLEPQPFQPEQDPTQNVMDCFLKDLDPEDADTPNDTQQPLERPPPDTHFEDLFGDLANNLMDFHPFANTSDVESDPLQDAEPVPDLGYPLDPLSDLPEELAPNFITPEHEPHEEDLDSHHPEHQDAENSDLYNEQPDNPAHQQVF